MSLGAINLIDSSKARSANPARHSVDFPLQRDQAAKKLGQRDYFLRWRIFARMRRFLRPSFRRPLPDFFVPKANSV